MADVTWEVAVDTDGDGSFGSDVTADVLDADWSVAFGQPHQLIAPPGRAILTLDNSGGQYGPEREGALAGFTAGTPLRIRSLHADEAGPLLGQEGIGDGLPCPLFGGSDYANLYSASLASAIDGDTGTLLIWGRVKDVSYWTDSMTAFLAYFLFSGGTGINRFFINDNADNKLYMYRAAQSVSQYVNLDMSAVDDWFLAGLTWDTAADELKGFLNGAQQGATQSGLAAMTGSLDSTQAVIGARNTSGENGWAGRLAHCALLDHVVTPAEFAALYAARADFATELLATHAGNIVGYWKLNEASAPGGQVAIDASGSGHHAAYNTVTRTRQHGVWWVKSIQPDPGQRGPRRVRVECEDALARAQREPAEVPIQLNERADEIIAALLKRVALYKPGFAGYWLLGVAGKSEIGQTTTLGDLSLYTDLDGGISLFPYAMDNNAGATSLYAALRLVAESEQGRVFVDRAGELVLWSRHHLPLLTDTVETFDDTMFDLDYRYGADITNRVAVRHNPRKLDDAGTPVLGTLERAVWVQAGQSREVLVRYADESGARISSTSVITPQSGTDYTANSAEDGGGDDHTAEVSVALEALAQAARLTFTSKADVDVYVQAGATVRGQNKLTDFGQVEVSYQDDDSVAAYGRRAEVVNARLLEQSSVAESLARWVVVQLKDARGEARRGSFRPRRSEALLTAGLGHTVGERLALAETQTGLSAEFFVVGERHRLRGGGLDYTVTWTLEPAGTQAFWILGKAGFSEIGQTTTVGY